MANASIYCSSMSMQLFRESGDEFEIGDRIDRDINVVQHKNSGVRFMVKRIDVLSIDVSELEDVKKDVITTRQLKHKNILPYFSCFVNKSLNEVWLLSPLCDYGSASNLSTELKLQEVSISFIIRDTLCALEYLHTRGIIHRAVRGSHILIHRATGSCMLTGLKYSTPVIKNGKWQLAVHDYPSNGITNLNWLAPEVLEQNLLGYDAKSDIYSLGITCCELANGVVPFAELQPTEMLLDKLTGNFPRLIDSTCQDLHKLDVNAMTAEDKIKHEMYLKRRFSDAFHSFTTDLCLGVDAERRPSATQLLSHNFITKQKKKYPNLIASLEADGIKPNMQLSPENTQTKISRKK
ncbi:STE20-related kinase adapter protein alpha-like protein, partial [Leptotrombidium deliense]